MARYIELVTLNGEQLKEDIANMAGNISLFSEAIGVSRETVRKATKGEEISAMIAKKITRGLFKPEGFYNTESVPKKVDDPLKGLNATEIISLLEDIKQEQVDTVKAIKTMTTLIARLLALWEGEKHDDTKSSNS